jgi:homoserine dehydrogenase
VTVRIGILGLGTVGTGTVQILQDPAGRHPLLAQMQVDRVGVKSIDRPRAVSFPDGVMTTDLESIVNDPQIDVIVEVMGGIEPARTLILQAIAKGKHIVTANKAVIARHGKEIFTAANQAGVYVLLEAAVGGGIPVIQPLKQSLGVNKINRVAGIINGTTNYILTEMTQAGGEFADILADAQALGYAEADPTADVDGLDAGDKIAILAALAFGGRIDRDAVSCEGIRKISAADIAYAEKLNFSIKLLGIAEQTAAGVSVRVHPTLVPKSHPLASVNGVNNAILVAGDPLGEVMLYGPGAGAGATAASVVADLVAIAATIGCQQPQLNPLLSCPHADYQTLVPLSSLKGRFYVRFVSRNVSGTIGQIGSCFGDRGVSIESIVQIGMQGDRAEIVVVTYETTEGDFRQALDTIANLSAIDSIPSILRVI